MNNLVNFMDLIEIIMLKLEKLIFQKKISELKVLIHLEPQVPLLEAEYKYFSYLFRLFIL